MRLFWYKHQSSRSDRNHCAREVNRWPRGQKACKLIELSASPKLDVTNSWRTYRVSLVNARIAANTQGTWTLHATGWHMHLITEWSGMITCAVKEYFLFEPFLTSKDKFKIYIYVYIFYRSKCKDERVKVVTKTQKKQQILKFEKLMRRLIDDQNSCQVIFLSSY